MKKHFAPFLAAWLVMIVLATLTPLRAQPATPLPPETEKSTPDVTPVPPSEPKEAVVEESEETSAPSVEKAEDSQSGELRELGKPEKKPKTTKKTVRRKSAQEEVNYGDVHVEKNQTRSEAVAVMGSVTVDGHVESDVVSVMGNSTVNGSANGGVVSVMGTTTVNGKASGDVVAVMGNVVLGPEAVVNNVVVVMGTLKRAEGAQVLGNIQRIGPGNFKGGQGLGEGLQAWVEKCLFYGRPLWVGEHLGWIWWIAGAFVAFYMILALIFPRGVVRSAEALEKRPGPTLLTALLTALLTPVAFVLLAVTGFGVVLIPFLGAALFMMSLFGMATVLAWFGRRVLGTQAEGAVSQPFFAVLVGGIIVSLLYMVPVLGFILWKLFGILGLGMVIYAMMVASRRDRPAAPGAVSSGGSTPPITPAPAPVVAATTYPLQSASFTGAPTQPSQVVPPPVVVEPPVMSSTPEPISLPAAATETTPPPAPAQPSFTVPPPVAPRAVMLPVISAATLPRVGFWLRLGASAIDAVLVGIVCGFMSSIFSRFGGGYPFWFALYCVCMWATKGTTIGGIICGLKVVRVDDRPIDWGVATVRALGGFLSLCAAGLGFIWVSFDDERQAWHDKIAGTTIVRVPKGTPLL